MMNSWKGRHGQAAVAPDAFGEGLVERDAVGEHARAGVGNAEHFEQGGDLRFARVAAESFGDVEADIGLRLAQGEGQVPVSLDKDGLVAVRFEGGADRVDRLDVVEVGERIRRNPLRFGVSIILDVGKDGDLPVAFHRRFESPVVTTSVVWLIQRLYRHRGASRSCYYVIFLAPMIAQCMQMTRVVTLKTRLMGDILGREAAKNFWDYRRDPFAWHSG